MQRQGYLKPMPSGAGHIPSQRLSNGFENGAFDEFTFHLSARALGEFRALKIANTGNDGWRLATLTATFGRGNTVTWEYDQWIDGNGASADHPAAEFFYADGTWASQGSQAGGG